MDKKVTVATAPKTSTFQMRINPDIKREVENIYANCGMTLTDAINAFLQQTLNVEGLPFLVTQNSREAIKEQATAILMKELKKGDDSVTCESDWLSRQEVLSKLGVEL